MVSPKQVCVIGAGVSGLAAAKVFAAHGHKVTIVEKARNVGGVWDPDRSYPDVQTQSPKDLYRYTDKAMPDAYPEWPKGPQVHAYLAGYASGHGLDRMIRFGTTVTSMRRRADGKPGWTLELQTPAGSSSEDFDFVAICTGQFSSGSSCWGDLGPAWKMARTASTACFGRRSRVTMPKGLLVM